MGIKKVCPKILPFAKIHLEAVLASFIIRVVLAFRRVLDFELYCQYNSKSKTRLNGFQMAPQANRQ